MKTSYKRILKTYNILLSGLLTLLGFASSSESREEYGTPSAKFIVNSTVKSADAIHKPGFALTEISINIVKTMGCA